MVANGIVYVSANPYGIAVLLALDAQTGAQKWYYMRPEELICRLSPTVASGILYLGACLNESGGVIFPDGAVYALENDRRGPFTPTPSPTVTPTPTPTPFIPGLSITNMASRQRVFTGEALNYLILLENSGSTDISVALTDTIPAGTSFISGTLVGGAVYSPTVYSILWSGTIAPGQSSLPSQVIDFRVRVSDAPSTGIITNTVAVSDGSVTITSKTTTPVWKRTFAPLFSRGSMGW